MAVPRFDLSDCLTLPVGFNTIYEGCCQRITCNVTNVHNTRLDVTDVFLSFGANYTVTIVSVNGFPSLTGLPFQVASGATFEMVFDVCSLNNKVGVLTVNFQTTQHGLDTPQNFNFNTVSMVNSVSPTAIDFGTVVQYSPSTPFSITITNLSSFGVDYSYNNGICPNEFTFSVVFPLLIVSGGSTTFDCIWTPLGPNDNLGSCTINFCALNVDDTNCNCTTVILDGLSTPAPVNPCLDCLCLGGVLIQTYEEATTLMNDELFGPNDTSIYSKSSICSSKRLTYFFTYENVIDTGFKVWFNPWMFAFTCDFDSKYPSSVNAPPPQGWFIEVNAAVMSIGACYQMNLIGTGSNQFNQKNFIVWFCWTATSEFQVYIDFYHIEDIDNWIANSSLLNNPKWRRNSVNAPNPSMGSNYENLIGSVYNTDKKLCSLTYIRDPNTLIEGEPTECYYNHSLNYTSRFYNSGLYGGASEFTGWTSPLPTFELTRSTGTQLNFSTIEKTNVTFRVKINSSFGGMGYCIFQLFDETGTNNTVDFLTNYDSSRAVIQTSGGTGIINNHIVLPSVNSLNIGDDWIVSAYVDTTVSPIGKYRMAAIVYSADGSMVNTFISEQILVTSTPDSTCDTCVLETDSDFNQYFHQNYNANCIRPTLKERIQHHVEISVGTFIDCLESWGGDYFQQYLTRISLNVYYKNAAFPTATQTTFFMFEQHVSNRVAGFPFGWQNLGNLIVKDYFNNVTTDFLTRVRWENTPFDGSNVFVANTATFMNRTNVGFLGNTYVSTLGINNNWSNGTINYEYIYQLDLSPLFGSPYIINMVKSFDVAAIPNEPNVAPISSHLIGFDIQGILNTGTAFVPVTNPFCPNDYKRIRVRYNSNINGNFIFFMEPYLGGNVNNILESENNSSPYGIPQLFNVALMDDDFNANNATAELDISTLGNGRYIVCGYLSLL
jgi:hypothetical protein